MHESDLVVRLLGLAKSSNENAILRNAEISGLFCWKKKRVPHACREFEGFSRVLSEIFVKSYGARRRAGDVMDWSGAGRTLLVVCKLSCGAV